MKFIPMIFNGTVYEQKPAVVVSSPYEGDSVLSPSSRLVASRLSGQGGKALGSIPEKNVQAIPGIRPDTVWFVAQLSLKSLPTGNYTLEVVTKDFGGDTSASNATAFDIR